MIMPRKAFVALQRTLALAAIMLPLWVLASLWLELPSATAISLLVTALAWKWWQQQLRHIFRVKKFSPVIPGRLYRSGQISRYRIARTLRQHGIQRVIDLTELGDNPDRHQRAEELAIRQLGIDGQRFPMHGNGTGDIAMVAGAIAAIHGAIRSNQPALVHCAAGVQRTGHVLSAYLLLVERSSPTAVFRFMTHFGWEPGDGNGWPAQLNQRMQALAVTLYRQGIIDEIPSPVPQLPLAPVAVFKPWWKPHHHLLAPIPCQHQLCPERRLT